MSSAVSEIFDPSLWTEVPGFDFTDITYHRAKGVGAVRIAFDRPEIRNAFRPNTVDELYTALDHARMSSDVGCVLFTGKSHDHIIRIADHECVTIQTRKDLFLEPGVQHIVQVHIRQHW